MKKTIELNINLTWEIAEKGIYAIILSKNYKPDEDELVLELTDDIRVGFRIQYLDMNIVVKREYLHKWGVGISAVRNQTLKNMPDCLFEGIGDYLYDRMPQEQRDAMLVTKETLISCTPPLWVLGNADFSRPYGASQVLNAKVLNSVHKTFGSDFFLIPSSIHEWLLAPTDMFGEDASEYLLDLCSSVNASDDILPEEVLGSFILKYDGKEVSKVA